MYRKNSTGYTEESANCGFKCLPGVLECVPILYCNQSVSTSTQCHLLKL